MTPRAFAPVCLVVVVAVMGRPPTDPTPAASAAASRPAPSAPASQPAPLISFAAEAVDGVDELLVRDATWKIDHLEWQPIRNAVVRVNAEFPRNAGMRAVIRNKVGRPQVEVVQHPSAENGHTLRIRMDDGPHAGAAPLAFDVFAEPVRRAVRPHNLVVITIDTLRPDRLGCYGCDRPTSPNIDRFAATALRFTNAYSTSSFTPPAHASLFTSRFVGDHGLLTWNPLPDDQLTLAEVLEEHDYRTAACIALDLLSSQNLGQGFALRREGFRDARAVVSDGLAAIRAAAGGPFFLWLHVYDVHRPYGGPAEWRRRFNESGRAGVGDGEEHYNLRPADVLERGLSGQDLAFIADRYDAGVAYVDSQLGPLLDELSSPQRRRDTLVVLTADHGESLSERPQRVFTHDPYLYGQVTRIPLLMRLPGGTGAGAVRDEMVSLLDIAPTLLDSIGVARPSSYQGRSLLPLLEGGPWRQEAVFMECWGWETRKAVRSARWSVVTDLKAQRTEFFDLSQDPDELRPLDAPPGPEAKALALRLAAFVNRPGAGRDAPELSREVRENLLRLGYLGSP